MGQNGNGTLPEKQSRGTGKPTVKQMFFALRYLKDLNATRAYREVYGSRSDNVAAVEGNKLLKNPKIIPLIEHAFQERAHRLEVDADMVLAELGHVAFIDPAEMYDERNALLPVRKMPEPIRRAVASVKTTELFEWIGEGENREKVLVGYTKEVKLWSKPSSLELHGKHLKLFTDKVEHTASGSLAELIASSRRSA